MHLIHSTQCWEFFAFSTERKTPARKQSLYIITRGFRSNLRQITPTDTTSRPRNFWKALAFGQAAKKMQERMASQLGHGLPGRAESGAMNPRLLSLPALKVALLLPSSSRMDSVKSGKSSWTTFSQPIHRSIAFTSMCLFP